MHAEAGTDADSRGRSARLVVAVFAFLAFSAVLSTAVHMARPGTAAETDYASFQTGAEVVLDGKRTQLYDLDVQQEIQQTEVAPGREVPGGVLPWVNPPYAVAPFVALAPLGLPWAYGAWALVNVAAFLGLLAVLFRLAPGWSRVERVLLVSGVLTFGAARIAFLQGQPTVVVTLGLALFALALPRCRRRRDPAGTPAGHSWLRAEGLATLGVLLASVKPQYAVLPVLVAAVQRRAALLGWLAAAGAALGAASTVAFGPAVWHDYLRLLSTFDRSEVLVHPKDMWNLRSLLVNTVLGSRLSLAHAVATASFGVAAVWLVWLWRRPVRPGPQHDARMALTVLLPVLTSPHTYTHDTLPVVIAAVLGWSAVRAGGRATDVRWYPFVALGAPIASIAGLALLGGLGGQAVLVPFVALAVLLVRAVATGRDGTGEEAPAVGRPDRARPSVAARRPATAG